MAGTPSAFCVLPEQLADCATMPDRWPCTVGGHPATCHGRVCLRDECGNHLLDSTEACDDGNTLGGDGCSARCDSAESCGNHVVDLTSGESCDDGGTRSHDDCASSCDRERPTWIPLRSGDPGARERPQLAYDLSRRRAVLHGGARPGSGQLDDTFEWDGTRWSRSRSTVVPLRGAGVMAYDSDRRRMVFFDGRETWERPANGEWELRVTVVKPDNFGYQAAYDARHRRIVMVGTSTWFWDGMSWQRAAAPSWPHRAAFGLAYDARRGVVVAFGGSMRQTAFDDVWELDGDTWTLRAAPARPAARTGTPLVYDPVTSTVLAVGGSVARNLGEVATAEVWSWDGSSWQRLADAIPEAGTAGITRHAVATDPTHGQVLVVDASGAMQTWDAAGWTVGWRSTTTELPARVHAAASYDRRRREVVVFGGTPTGAPADATSTLVFWDGAWSTADPAITPDRRIGATLVYDEARDEHVLFGGFNTTVLDDTWILRDRVWSRANPARSPPGRHSHASLYDPVRQQVVIHGGASASGDADDTWAWDGSSWTEIQAPTRPAPRYGASFAFDRLRGTGILFGGVLSSGATTDETWLWDGTWRAGPVGPPARLFGAMAWDEARQRVVLYGGTTMTESSDAWEWDGAGWAVVVASPVPPARSGHAMVAFDAAGVLVLGGIASAGSLADAWQLRWEADPRAELCTDSDTDDDNAIGCADADCATHCAGSCGDGACNRASEDCYSCAADCGVCPPVCGNEACDAGETPSTCFGDC